MRRALLLLVCMVLALLALLAPSAAAASTTRDFTAAGGLALIRAQRTYLDASPTARLPPMPFAAGASSRAASRRCAVVPPSVLPHPRAGRRPSTDQGEAAGEAGREGASHVFEYDALDRLKKVTRLDGAGLTVAVEDYAFNALGALQTNAGVALDHRRPRLDGAGAADAAVPATLDGLAVGLDRGGRVNLLHGIDLAWNATGQLQRVVPPIPSEPVQFGFDAFDRRVWTLGTPTINASEFYLYEGVNRIAALSQDRDSAHGLLRMSFLYDGVDHPLRVATVDIIKDVLPHPPAPPQVNTFKATPKTMAYYELDLAGNVRRLRAPGGKDQGGYRYSAFGQLLESTVQDIVWPAGVAACDSNVPHTSCVDVQLQKQPLRWKGMWRFDLGGGTELYDARARMWSPALGSFLSIDELAFPDRKGTFWSWPHQNPIRWRDPSGRTGVFTWASAGASVPGPFRPGGEVIGIAGVDTDAPHGLYTAGVTAVGVEVGGEANEVGVFYGVEQSSDGHITPISLAELHVGIEIPDVVGLSGTLGGFSTDESIGWYWGPKAGVIGEHASAGFGVSISKSWLPDWLTGGPSCPTK